MIDQLSHLGHLHWMVAGFIFLILEMFGAAGFLLWTSIAAFCVALLTWIGPTLSWQIQLAIFAFATIASSVTWWFYLKKHPQKSDKPTLNARAEQYIGRTFILAEPIADGKGKLRVDDTFWQITAEQDCPAGTRVKVIAVESMVLTVEKQDGH